MKLVRMQKSCDAQVARLTAVIENSHDTVEVWFEYTAEFADFIREDADVFIPVMLPAAMLENTPLDISMPVSRSLYQGLDEFQDIFHTWHPATMHRVELRLPQIVQKKSEQANATAAFFSGGVDSFYTALKRRHSVETAGPAPTHLLYMRGLETPLSQDSDTTVETIKKIANELGYKLIVGATNLRDVFPLDWGEYYCGPGLAAVGLSLSAGIGNVMIPSSSSYRPEDLYPWSTHPLTDRLWSTEYCQIRQCGCEATRAEKLANVVGRDPISLEYLRVCTDNCGEFFNCGQCPKCIRTMIALAAFEQLQNAGAFPVDFHPRMIKKIDCADLVERQFLEEILELAKINGFQNQTVHELEKILRYEKRKQALAQLTDNTPLATILKTTTKVWHKLKKIPG